MLSKLAKRDLLQAGALRVDVGERRAWCDGRLLPVTGLPLRILELLLQAEGRLVTRAELKSALWPYAIRIDTERRLNTAVRALREALGDSAHRPTHIETVRGVGYRWVGPNEPQRPGSRGLPSAMAIAAAGVAVLAVLALPLLTGRASQALAYDRDRTVAWRLVNQGRSDAARPHLTRLIAAAVPDAASAADTGWLLLRAGNPEAALAVCAATRAPSINLLSCRQTALARLGQVAPARDTALAIMRMAGSDPAMFSWVADAPAAVGYAHFLQWRIDHFVPRTGDWFHRAQLQADAGHYADALHSLRRAADAKDPLLAKINSTIEFGPLRGSPDFERIAAAASALAAGA